VQVSPQAPLLHVGIELVPYGQGCRHAPQFKMSPFVWTSQPLLGLRSQSA
jgi:hypothetical protein